jgi:hypothetical protein
MHAPSSSSSQSPLRVRVLAALAPAFLRLPILVTSRRHLSSSPLVASRQLSHRLKYVLAGRRVSAQSHFEWSSANKTFILSLCVDSDRALMCHSAGAYMRSHYLPFALSSPAICALVACKCQRWRTKFLHLPFLPFGSHHRPPRLISPHRLSSSSF